ncbi:MAG TPA: UMP kinase [Candidatus Magasanikbacteria bacterium]|nr:UMP kinase [Candidatus Magasanikbacteria bacterium]
MKKTIVISLGGSIIIPKTGFDPKFLRSFVKMILSFKKDYKFILVCGGGNTARLYQGVAKNAGKLQTVDLDWIGIYSTRLNARLMQALFGKNAHFELVIDPTKTQKWTTQVMIAAGWKPGFSTDYDAVLLAKKYGADTVINLSNIDYVYDKDPRTNKDAKKLESVGWVEFQKIVGTKWVPGANVPFDPVATALARKNKMKVLFVKGDNLTEVKKAIGDKKIKGTVIN